MSLYDVLACPICKAQVEPRESRLHCVQCERDYPVINGVPIMLPGRDESDIPHEEELVLREEYNPWIERMIMQSLTDGQIVVDAGCGNMRLDDPCLIRMDVKLTPYVDVVGDLHTFPFKPASVDFVFALAVFEHLRQPFTAAEEIYAALKPGGYVYAECNFIFAYHGYPHHYFNATVQGLQQIFSRFREMRVGVAPYQMPSFAVENLLNTYLNFFRASNLTERMFVMGIRSLLQFPLRYYDSKFTPETAFRLSAGDYFAGIKQPNRDDTIIPPVILDVYSRSPELQAKYPDPTNLVSPENLMTWAKTEGRESHPEVAAYFAELPAFSKYSDPSHRLERKIVFEPGLRHPDQQRYIAEGTGGPGPTMKILRMVFERLHEKWKVLGPVGLLKWMLAYLGFK